MHLTRLSFLPLFPFVLAATLTVAACGTNSTPSTRPPADSTVPPETPLSPEPRFPGAGTDLGKCQDDSDNIEDICMDFPAELRLLCKQEGGGEQACASNRWSKDFYERLLAKSTALAPPPQSPAGNGDAVPAMSDFSYSGATFKKEWVSTLVTSIPSIAPDLLKSEFLKGGAQKEINELCPDFSSRSEKERAHFWALMMASIAYPESGYNPRTVFREPPPLNENSVGLLQLSTSNSAHGKECVFKSEEELKDPHRNLKCGVLIMRNQIAKHHEIFTDGYFYYWSVLRNKPSQIRDVFKRNVSKIPICR